MAAHSLRGCGRAMVASISDLDELLEDPNADVSDETGSERESDLIGANIDSDADLCSEMRS